MGETIKVARDHLYSINNVLEGMKGIYSSKLKYAIKRNKDHIKGEIDAITEGSKTNVKGFEEYEAKRTEKLKVCLEFDSEGKPVIDPLRPNSFKLKEDKVEEFNSFMNLLNDKHKEDINNRNKEIEEFNIFLKETVEIEVYKISNDLIPEDLDQNSYEVLFPLINE
jgi:hypothetical protein